MRTFETILAALQFSPKSQKNGFFENELCSHWHLDRAVRLTFKFCENVFSPIFVV